MPSAFVPEEGTSSGMSDADLASAANVTEDMVTAFRAGVPYWKLQIPGAADRLALAIGVDSGLVKARIREAYDAIWGRNAGSFPSGATFSSGLRI